MPTVLEILTVSSGFLTEKKIESARLNAELLLAHVLNCKRFDLYLRYDKPLTDIELENYRSLVRRRIKNEPYQYITGNCQFYGLNFKCDSRALIPRPETELLVESVIDEIKQVNNPLILDIGTGSGNIIISLAKNLKTGEFTSIDISIEALNLARENATINNCDKINFINASIFDFEGESRKYDAIVSNPPYVSQKDFKELPPEILHFEPEIALTDKQDGLQFYRMIAQKGKDWLKPGAKIYFEAGYGQSEQISNILKQNGFSEIKIKNDYSHIPRIISGVKK